MGLRIAMIADDLTGALDSAEPFARAGARVAVATSIAALDAVGADLDMIAVNTDSRALAADAAQHRVVEAWKRLAPRDPDILFKKIDSRLKGHVGAEVQALLDASGRTRAVIAPAVPAMRRWVRDGGIDGTGIDAPLSIAERAAPCTAFAAPDCRDAGTLTSIAEALVAAGSRELAVGAAGLAESLAALLEFAPGPEPIAPASRLIMLIGSRDPITRAQLDHLAGSGVACLRPARDGLLDPADVPRDARVVAIHATDGGGASPETVAARLGALAAQLARPGDAILASGGDTAMAVVAALGLAVLTPVGRAAPGVPIATARWRDTTLRLITKSGGFGAPDCLTEIARTLVQPPAASTVVR